MQTLLPSPPGLSSGDLGIWWQKSGLALKSWPHLQVPSDSHDLQLSLLELSCSEPCSRYRCCPLKSCTQSLTDTQSHIPMLAWPHVCLSLGPDSCPAQFFIHPCYIAVSTHGHPCPNQVTNPIFPPLPSLPILSPAAREASFSFPSLSHSSMISDFTF